MGEDVNELWGDLEESATTSPVPSQAPSYGYTHHINPAKNPSKVTSDLALRPALSQEVDGGTKGPGGNELVPAVPGRVTEGSAVGGAAVAPPPRQTIKNPAGMGGMMSSGVAQNVVGSFLDVVVPPATGQTQIHPAPGQQLTASDAQNAAGAAGVAQSGTGDVALSKGVTPQAQGPLVPQAQQSQTPTDKHQNIFPTGLQTYQLNRHNVLAWNSITHYADSDDTIHVSGPYSGHAVNYFPRPDMRGSDVQW